MGRRKSRKKPPTSYKKKGGEVATSFDCPFCNHEEAVEVKIDLQTRIGKIICTVCSTNWQSQVTPLTQPVDVYSDWLDECEKKNAPEESA